jgi:hypothetical protein
MVGYKYIYIYIKKKKKKEIPTGAPCKGKPHMGLNNNI